MFYCAKYVIYCVSIIFFHLKICICIKNGHILISACAGDPYMKFTNKFRPIAEGKIVNLDNARRFALKEDECKFECLMDNLCREVQYRCK